jgi:hypothetical protein
VEKVLEISEVLLALGDSGQANLGLIIGLELDDEGLHVELGGKEGVFDLIGETLHFLLQSDDGLHL